MRGDGRRADELRELRFELDFTENPSGSVLCGMGRTLVLCTVCEEDGVPRWLRGSGRGWVSAEYSMLPGATDRRGDREASRGRPSGRTLEIQRLIGRSLRGVVDLDRLGERTLWVDCDVLQADGGTRCASVTGAYMALSLAVQRMLDRGELAETPLVDFVAAVSVGLLGGEVFLDLPYEEDSRADVDLNVVATGAGRLVEVQGTGEGATFEPAQLTEMTALALRGTRELIERQREALERHPAG
ncbi:MAG: ribonuclease PH [Myxococcales bacterium]|nr:ribonuclease PH [Myxococcales bacterium]